MRASECRKFKLTGNYIFSHTMTKYSGNGKTFRKNADIVETEVVTIEHYNNFITSVPFFNNFGYGAYCRCYENYTIAGYIPYKIVTVNPGKTVKHVDTFYPLAISENRLGFREKDVLYNLGNIKLVENSADHFVVRFFHTDNEHAFDFDFITGKVTG